MNCKLFCGDCMDVLKEMDSKSIDLICCDLPYGQTHNKWDTSIPMEDYIFLNGKCLSKEKYFLQQYKKGISYQEANKLWNDQHQTGLWTEYKRLIKDNGAIILFGTGAFSAYLIQSNLKMYRYSLIWHKKQPGGFLNARRMPLKTHEDILVFYKKLPVYHPQMSHGHTRKVSSSTSQKKSKESSNYASYMENRVSYDSTDRFPTSIWTFSKDTQKSAYHPTQKPVSLLEEIIKTYSNEGDTVLDNCMGSGSCGVACANTGRYFIGIEKDTRYFVVASQRICHNSGTLGN